MSSYVVSNRYTGLYNNGTLGERAEMLNSLLSPCELCPMNCKVDRLNNEKGICRTGRNAMVSSYSAHFGEERPLVGQYGSGTIFFTNCNLHCKFCQNYDISHLGRGIEVDDKQLAEIMIELQERGCHNINLVTPSHVVPQIIAALVIAVAKGLNIPLVFNTGAYDKVSTLKLLDGIIDIYMPDFKFWDNEFAFETCGIDNYRSVAINAVNEMYKQVGDLQMIGDNIAIRGLLVRHLVMPGYIDDTKNILSFISESISRNTYVNIMAQYRPSGKAHNTKRLNRPLTAREHSAAIDYARSIGLQRIDY